MQVIKISGNDLSNPNFLQHMAQAIANMSEPTVLVHGGDKAIAEMQQRFGVTDAESLTVAQMMLSGHTNKTIVTALLKARVQAVGLSGVDGGLLQCQKKEHPFVDLGYVGEIIAVNADLIACLIEQGITPVISPISVDIRSGQVYNVNADTAASAMAQALNARLVTFVSNVPDDSYFLGLTSNR